MLAALLKTDGYVSGEVISHTLGISRAAVNLAIKTLRKEGYDILSSTNRGYMMKNAPDRLNTGELLSLLPQERMENVICLDIVGSTNDYLRTLAQNGAPDGQVIIANQQTKGRGRRGRSFLSPKDKGIYMSLLMRPDSIPADTSCITAWAAVAMSDVIEKVCGIRPKIKWVNDLVINKKKVCGILTEMSVESESGHIQYLIIGIGLNVNERDGDFPNDIGSMATSLTAETGKRIKLNVIACEMINQLDEMRRDWPHSKEKYYNTYRKHCITLGKEVLIKGGENDSAGFAEDIDNSFGLVIKLQDGSKKYVSSGEVSVRGLYGYI